MKFKSILPVLFLSAFILFAIPGCKKQNEAIAPSTDNSALYESEAVAIIDDADVMYNDVTIAGGSETDAFYAENEGLPEAYLLVETDMDDAGFKRSDRRYLGCIKKLQLTDTQAHMIRHALRAYEECKSADIKRHREAYAKLVLRIENSRRDLAAQLKNGKITRTQFGDGLAKLRKDFQESLRSIKASYATTLKACYDKFLRATKGILTERQWKAFVNCYR